MNLGVSSVKSMRVTMVSMILVVIGGIVAYAQLGRLEDPEFTIKEALIITPYPGASPEEVAREVTNPIEIAAQQMGQLDRVQSESTRGLSIVRAMMKDKYHRADIPQVWDELRRKVNDVQSQLPPAVRGRSMVLDDFGDVYGVFFAITGDGYSYPELRRYADFLRRELSLVQDVKRVELFADQREVVYLEISRVRLAQLGINEEQIYGLLRSKNTAADGGRVRMGDEHIVLDPKGAFESADEILDLAIGSDSTGRQLFLRDVAEVKRDHDEPPRRILRFDGKPAIGLGVSTVLGGNVVVMGEGIRKRMEELKRDKPVGIEIGEINFQPEAVEAATGAFVFNLVKAVTIVFVVLLIAMGLRAGFMVGIVLLITILGTLILMYMKGILMERISLGAFIIALCMLTDNAIVITEGMKVRIENGEDKIEVIRDVVAQCQWPLFGATAIAVISFAAIGLSEDSTGEYTNSLFWVIALSLSISWIAAITATPALGYLIFKPTGGKQDPEDAYKGWFFRGYRAVLVTALRLRVPVMIVAALLFVAGVLGFRHVKQSFFPPATRPQFLVDVYLPAGTHIRQSEAFASQIEGHLLGQKGVSHVSTFVGGGGLRFLLVYTPEMENRAYVEFLVNVEDESKIDEVLAATQTYLDEQYPDANAISKKFLLGPGGGGRVQVRFSGPDPARLRQLAAEAEKVLVEDGGAKGVRDDWREQELAVRPKVLELTARRNGITRTEIAQALETGFEGRTVGLFREPGGAGGGVYPQEARLLPIIARPPESERVGIDSLRNLPIWSPAAGRMIPLSQVVSGEEIGWEDSVIMRRDRTPTITVHADPRSGLPSELFGRVREKIEKIELPEGYTMAWGGEHEDSARARRALAGPLPVTLALSVFIVLCIFNSIRATVVICAAVPLIVIGITFGLLVTGQAFGFMALLGAIALVGEQIKNSIVLIDEVKTQRYDYKKDIYDALVDGSVSRLRPVMLVVVTTVLGMIPLLADPFFSAMAVLIMFGLAFAAVLTMIVVPVLYSFAYRIDTSGRRGNTSPVSSGV